MQSPSVSRIVHFYENALQPEPYFAVITKVTTHNLVNLMVFPPHGDVRCVENVLLCGTPTHTTSPDIACCVWPSHVPSRAPDEGVPGLNAKPDPRLGIYNKITPAPDAPAQQAATTNEQATEAAAASDAPDQPAS